MTQHLLELSALEQANVPEHLSSLVGDTVHGAHSYASGLDTVVMTNRGTQPGRSMADLTFNLVMRRKVQRIRQRLDQEGVTVKTPGGRSLMD